MAIIKLGAFEGLLRKRDPAVGILLIYGGNPASVRDLASKAVQGIAGSLGDPFNVVLLDESAISGDHSRIIDEVMSLSFLGGPRVIWFRGADQNFLKSVEPVLAGSISGNLIVAEAGNLAKTSILRTRLESSDHAVVLPVYDADVDTLNGLLAMQLRNSGLRIADEGRTRLIELIGRGGVALQPEIEKLKIYCHGGSTITLDDVEAICGDGLWAGTDDLADAVFGGDVLDVDRFFTQLVSSGVDPGRILTAAHGHTVRLIEYRQKIDQGLGIEQVVKSARPPIFFKRQPAIMGQLRTWTSETLLSAAVSLSAAIQQSRLNSGLAASLANRALLATARSSRAARERLS